jgi:hypothetical protein
MALTIIFRLTRWAVLWFVVSTAVAMLIYPGGTYRDPSSPGYSFSRNFLSDLGNTVAWGGGPNRWGASLFVGAEVLLAAALVSCFAALVILFSSSPSRHWARAAGLVGIAACAALVAAALLPADRFLALHVQAAKFTFRGILATSLLFTIAAARDPRFPRRATIAWALLTLLFAAYVALIEWGPRLDTDPGLVVQATAQKMIVLAALSGFAYQSYEAGLVSERQRSPRRLSSPGPVAIVR